MEDSFPDFLKDTCDDYAETMMSGDSSEENDKQAIKAELAKELPVVGEEDQRKTRRRLANRESARRTRQRKADMLRSLSTEVVKLTNRNFWLQARLANITKQHQKASLENQILRQQLHDLSMSTSLQLQDMSPMFGLAPMDISAQGPSLNPTAKAASPCPIPPHLDLFPPSLACLPHIATTPAATTTPTTTTNTMSPPLLPISEAPPPTPVTPAANASLPSVPSTPHSPLNNFTTTLPVSGEPELIPELGFADLASYFSSIYNDDTPWGA